MWPYLVGVEIRGGSHRQSVRAKLANLAARPILPGVWLVHSDFGAAALLTALRAMLSDTDRFFVAPVEEGLAQYGFAEMRKI